MLTIRTLRPAGSPCTDTEIIARVMNGEKECYEILMRRHSQTLYRAVRGYLHEQEEVEAVMQETFVKAYAKLARFQGGTGFSIWLLRIGVNEALQQLGRDREKHVHPPPEVHSR